MGREKANSGTGPVVETNLRVQPVLKVSVRAGPCWLKWPGPHPGL